jgi:hypothetical protein
LHALIDLTGAEDVSNRLRTTSCTRFLILGTVTALILGQTAPAWAWGHNGHRIVAKFASTRLNSKARVAIHDLLEDGEDIADASTYPDEHKTKTDAAWHFVNLPLKETAYKDEFCDSGTGCVVQKIEDFRRVLSDPKTDQSDKRRALRFLVHLVGDIHQPLHVADNHDRGGNGLHVDFFRRSTNLHAVWDEGMLMFDPSNDREEFGKRVDEGAWVTRLDKLATEERVKEWSKATQPSDWATESLIHAKAAYLAPKTGLMIKPGDRLDDDYEATHLPVVEKRLAQAGVRLADILNETIGK